MSSQAANGIKTSAAAGRSGNGKRKHKRIATLKPKAKSKSRSKSRKISRSQSPAEEDEEDDEEEEEEEEPRTPKRMFTCEESGKVFHSKFVYKVHLKALKKVAENPTTCDKYYHYYLQSGN